MYQVTKKLDAGYAPPKLCVRCIVCGHEKVVTASDVKVKCCCNADITVL